jgi:putative transposase
VALFLDGLDVAGQTVIVALGVTSDGTKVPLGLWLGSTETRRCARRSCRISSNAA